MITLINYVQVYIIPRTKEYGPLRFIIFPPFPRPLLCVFAAAARPTAVALRFSCRQGRCEEKTFGSGVQGEAGVGGCTFLVPQRDKQCLSSQVGLVLAGTATA